MKNLGKLLLVIVAAAGLTIAGCAATGGGAPGNPESTDVNADVLTERKILSAIADDPGLEATTIGVSCINGVVTLRGSVGSAIERELAERVAKSVSGVTAVNNLLTFT